MSATRQPPALSVMDGTAQGPAWPWWSIAAIFLGSSLVGVLLWAVVSNAGAVWFGGPPPVTVNGADLGLARGSGHPEDKSFLLESTQDDLAVLSVAISPVQAKYYTRVEWKFRFAAPSADMAFAWRTQEEPGRLFSKPLEWLGDGIAPLALDSKDGWRGTIIGLALLVRGSLPVPLEVVSVGLPPATAGATLIDMLAQWTSRVPLKGYAIALPFDAERAHFLPLVEAVGIAACVACLAYWLISRRRGWPFDSRVLWAIFAVAWLVLDLRWHALLARELALSADRYWGKTGDERSLASEEAALVALARDIKSSLPPPPVRIVVLSDFKMLAIRLAYYLYPHNVSLKLPSEAKGSVQVIPPDRASLRRDDNVVLAYYSPIRYVASRQVLEWPNGGTLPAELILETPDGLLVRIR